MHGILAAKDHKRSGDDIVIVSAVRTPIGRGKKGGFKDTTPDDLLAAALEGAVKRVNLDPALVDDIQVGNVLPPGGGAINARQAMFYAGFFSFFPSSLPFLFSLSSSSLSSFLFPPFFLFFFSPFPRQDYLISSLNLIAFL